MSLRSVVLLNDAAYVDGGGSQVAIASALGLASRGVEVALVSAAGPPSPALADRVRVRCTNQATIADDPHRASAAARGLWNFASSAAVREVLRDYDPAATVVHVHGWTKALSSSALHAAVDAGFRIVVTLHDYFAACPNGSYYDHGEKRICTRRAMGAGCIAAHCDSRSYPTKLYRVARQIVQAKLGGMPRSIRHYIYVSNLSYRVLAPYLPADACSHAVRNPIDVAKMPAADPGATDAFVYVGRLSPEKGGALLAEAALRADAPLHIVGDGEERELIERILPAARVTGWVSRERVYEALDHARALVLPSLWYEALALVVLEAAARGIPAIVPDACAASELIRDGWNGLVFRTGSVAELTACLRRLRDPVLARTMGANAYRAYWERPATLENHVNGLTRVYEHMLAEPVAS